MDMYLNIFEESEHSRLDRRSNRNAGNSTTVMLAVVAIVVVVLGLLFFASQNTPADLSPGDDNPNTVLDNTNQPTNNTNSAVSTTPTPADIAAGRSRARAELATIQSQFATDEDYAKAEASVNELEADLERVYGNSTGAARVQWEETKEEFDRFEQALRNSSADAASILAGLILMLEEEVRTDEDE